MPIITNHQDKLCLVRWFRVSTKVLSQKLLRINSKVWSGFRIHKSSGNCFLKSITLKNNCEKCWQIVDVRDLCLLWGIGELLPRDMEFFLAYNHTNDIEDMDKNPWLFQSQPVKIRTSHLTVKKDILLRYSSKNTLPDSWHLIFTYYLLLLTSLKFFNIRPLPTFVAET